MKIENAHPKQDSMLKLINIKIWKKIKIKKKRKLKKRRKTEQQENQMQTISAIWVALHHRHMLQSTWIHSQAQGIPYLLG